MEGYSYSTGKVVGNLLGMLFFAGVFTFIFTQLRFEWSIFIYALSGAIIGSFIVGGIRKWF